MNLTKKVTMPYNPTKTPKLFTDVLNNEVSLGGMIDSLDHFLQRNTSENAPYISQKASKVEDLENEK